MGKVSTIFGFISISLWIGVFLTAAYTSYLQHFGISTVQLDLLNFYIIVTCVGLFIMAVLTAIISIAVD